MEAVRKREKKREGIDRRDLVPIAFEESPFAIAKKEQQEWEEKSAPLLQTIVAKKEKPLIDKQNKSRYFARQKASSIRWDILFAITKYALIAISMVAFSLGEIYYIRPFGAAFFIALVFVKVPFLAVAPPFLVGELLGGGWVGLVSGAVVVAIVAVGMLILRKTKYKKQLWFLIVVPSLAIFSQFSVITFTEVPYTALIAYGALVLAFSAIAKVALKPIIIEKLKYKMLNLEFACFSALLVALAIGVSRFVILGFPVGALLGVFTIYMVAKTVSASKAIVASIVFGLGATIGEFSFEPLAAFAFIAVAAVAFLGAPKIIMPITGTAGFLLFRFLFFGIDGFDLLWTIAVVAGGLIYFLMPKRLINYLKNHLVEKHDKTAVRYMLLHDRAQVATKLYSAAEIYRTMATTLKGVEREMPKFTDALLHRCCDICSHRGGCPTSKEKTAALNKMLQKAIERKSLAISDIDEIITHSCKNLSLLVSEVNLIVEQYEQLQKELTTSKAAREIVSVHMDQVGEVLEKLAGSTKNNAKVDNERERVLVTELNYGGVSAKQAVISKNSVTLVLRVETFDRANIEKIVTRVCGKAYSISGLDDTMLSGFVCTTLEAKPKATVVFGVAQASKKKAEGSGDTHSFTKIAHDKFMMALCDGMGSGERAKKSSTEAIGLVENFYKAGFEAPGALAAVNNFLSSQADENFSALDICVIDLNSLEADIIKLASPASYIKRSESVDKVEGEAPPLGVLEVVSPSIFRTVLKMGDIFVLCSDGVTESFRGDKLAAIINNARTVNPQLLAESIIEQVLQIRGSALKDDCTVVCARVVAS